MKDELIKFNFVEGIVVFGSYGRREEDFYSDVDLIVYLNRDGYNHEKINLVKKNVIQLLNNIGEKVLLRFERHNKWMLYTKKSIVKLEMQIKSISKAKDDVIYIVESRIDYPENAIILDKNGIINQVYKNHWIRLNGNERIHSKFLDNIYGFIYYYDGFLLQFARGDVYRAYMNYTLAFYKLATLMALAEGEYRNLYQPWYLTRDVVKDSNLREMFYSVSSTIRPLEMFSKKDEMVSSFLDTVKRGKTLLNINFNESEFQNALRMIIEKYPTFYNFRDITQIINFCSKSLKIKQGLIFRCASLSRYDSKTISRFLEENNISYIVDLRSPEEIEKLRRDKKRGYSKHLLENYVINIPISTKVPLHIEGDPYKNFYYGMLKQSRNQIKTLFQQYFSNADKNRLILHCEGGKDRTGLIVALLLDIIGIERECIVEDFCMSYSDTKRENIEFVFDIIDKESKGTANYLLKYCNIPANTIQNVRKILVNKNENSHNR